MPEPALSTTTVYCSKRREEETAGPLRIMKLGLDFRDKPKQVHTQG